MGFNKNLLFPLSIFPAEILEIINDTHRARYYPLNYIAAAIFFNFSSAIGNTRYAYFNDMRVINVMYMCLLGKSGSVKSHPIKFALQPLSRRNNQFLLQYDKELQDYRKLSPEHRTIQPIPRQLVVKDFTIEALAKIHKHNPRGISVVVDELRQWLSQFNRYRSSGDVEQWLAMFNGDSIICNRKSVDDIICVPETSVNIIGGLQPELLPKIFSGEYTDNGLLQRLLFVNNDADDKPLMWRTDDIPFDSDERYEQLINSVIDICGLYDNELSPVRLSFSELAISLLITWQNAHEDDLAQAGDDTDISIFRKIQIYVLRFCIVIHMMKVTCSHVAHDTEIDDETAMQATLLGNYFFMNAKEVSNYIAGGDEPKALFKILDRLDSVFTAREAVEIGEMLHISRRTVYRFLNSSNQYIRKISHGKYQKII